MNAKLLLQSVRKFLSVIKNLVTKTWKNSSASFIFQNYEKIQKRKNKNEKIHMNFKKSTIYLIKKRIGYLTVGQLVPISL